MITISDYFMGRDKSHAAELTDAMRADAEKTASRVNQLLAIALYDGVDPPRSAKTGTPVSSGWRPAAINKAAGGAPKSNHLLCRAIDIYDPQDKLDGWCLCHLDQLEKIGLWLEHPSATPGWCHLQTVPPKSGRRVFYP